MLSVYSAASVDWATGILVSGRASYPSAEMQSVYSTAPGDWATGILVGARGASYPSAEMQSVYSTAPGDLGHRNTRWCGGASYPSAEMQSVYSTAPGDWATGILVGAGGGVLPLYRDAVGVFYSSRWLGHRNTRWCGGASYPSAEMQSVYSTAPGDWATGYSLVQGGGNRLTPLQRCSRCTLLLQLTGL